MGSSQLLEELEPSTGVYWAVDAYATFTTIDCWHSPVIEGAVIERALARIGELPSLPPLALPYQSVLEQIVAASALLEK